jgi:hypothetical protein
MLQFTVPPTGKILNCGRLQDGNGDLATLPSNLAEISAVIYDYTTGLANAAIAISVIAISGNTQYLIIGIDPVSGSIPAGEYVMNVSSTTGAFLAKEIQINVVEQKAITQKENGINIPMRRLL